MKKVLVTGLLAICAIAVAQQEASAWVNSKFSMGMNWEYQSGGNSFAWGLWRNLQPGEPMPSHGKKCCDTPGQQPHAAYAPAYLPPAPQAPIYLAPTPAPAPGHHPHGVSYGPQPYATPYGQPMQTPGFQFATYPRPVYYQYGR